jgi:hypothetical protein
MTGKQCIGIFGLHQIKTAVKHHEGLARCLQSLKLRHSNEGGVHGPSSYE